MRSWVLLIALSSMLVLVAACSNDDDAAADDVPTDDDSVAEVQSTPTPEPEPEPTETPEPEPTATPEPEPTETPIPDPEPEGDDAVEDEAAEAAEDDEDATSTDRSGRAASQDAGELGGLLVSIDDLPEGWMQVDDEFIDGEDIADMSDEPFEAPCGIEPLDETMEPIAEGERSFQGSELGPFFSQTIVQLESADEAREVMDKTRELFGCDEWTETDEFGDEITFTIEELPFEDFGDDSLAITLGLTFDNLSEEESMMMAMFGEFSLEMVILQRDEYVSMLMYFDLFGMSDTDLESLVRIADEKLQSAN